MAEPYIGEIKAVAFNYAPRGWAKCEGQFLNPQQQSSLFALLGNTYGGDGQTTFALPDLRGRVLLGVGQAPDSREYLLGEKNGYTEIQLRKEQMPQHNHSATFTSKESEPITANATIKVKSGKGDEDSAGGNYFATGEAKNGRSNYAVQNGYSTTADTTMNSQAVEIEITGGKSTGDVIVDNAGSNVPISVMQPSLAVYYIIALDGIFPPRR